MNSSPPILDRLAEGQCPGDAELRRFDDGTMSGAEVDKLSDHIAGCSRCSTILTGQSPEDTRMMASLLTPGRNLLAEAEFAHARQALLEHPETVPALHLNLAETVPSLDRPSGWKPPAAINLFTETLSHRI